MISDHCVHVMVPFFLYVDNLLARALNALTHFQARIARQPFSSAKRVRSARKKKGTLPCAIGPSRAASPMLSYVKEANERTTGWIKGDHNMGVVSLQPTVIASRASPPLLEQRIVDARRPSMNKWANLPCAHGPSRAASSTRCYPIQFRRACARGSNCLVSPGSTWRSDERGRARSPARLEIRTGRAQCERNAGLLA